MTRGYRHERVVLSLVAVIALSFFHQVGPQDITRLALAQAVTGDGSLRIDRWQRETVDKAIYEGRYYSDKAPGISFLAVPPMVALRAAGVVDAEVERRGVWKERRYVWGFRVLIGGVGFLLATFLVGRVAEALAAGTGAASATAFGLGTLALPLSTTLFQHVLAAAMGFAAFVLAWSGVRGTTRNDLRCAASGVLAGVAVLVEYQAVVVVAVVFVYLLTRTRRGALVFVLAGLPCAAALAAYNTLAFESPLHVSYSYVSAQFAEQQSKGLFGIGVPNPVDLGRVLFSWDGLLIQSPVLVLAGVGVALLWRTRHRAEAAACGAVTILFLALNAGYYDPRGGLSPGPRFFIPALPFLAVGLPLAVRRWPFLTLGATAVSIGVMIYRAGTWARPRDTAFITVWSMLGAPRLLAAFGLSALAVAALMVTAKEAYASHDPTADGDAPDATRG